MTSRILNSILLLLLVSALIACVRQQQRTSVTVIDSDFHDIVLDPDNAIFMPNDSLIESTSYIKLETNENCLIGKIDQLLVVDSSLIVVDKQIAKAIHIFDMKGFYKYSIGKRGPGPEEYVEITHVCRVPGKNEIAVLDWQVRKVLFYTIEGKLLRVEKTPFLLNYFEYLESGNIAYNAEIMHDPDCGIYKDNSLIVADKNNRIIYGACRDFYSDHFRFISPHPLHKFGDDVYYTPSFNDTIFQITDTAAVAKYAVNIVKYGQPKIDENTTGEMMREYTGQYLSFEGDYLVLKDIVYVKISAYSSSPFLIYSKKTRKTYVNSAVYAEPLKYFLSNYETPLATCGDDVLIHFADALRILQWKNNIYRTDKSYHASIDSLYDGLTEDSNPVLFFYKMRTDFEE
jgi:hypothetical protein